MELFIFVTGITVGLMLLCGGIQRAMASRTTRKVLLLPFPILCGFSCLYTFVQTVRITGWEWLIWQVLLICTICVFIGTMIGWASGNEKRKKRQVLPATPKEDL